MVAVGLSTKAGVKLPTASVQTVAYSSLRIVVPPLVVCRSSLRTTTHSLCHMQRIRGRFGVGSYSRARVAVVRVC